MTDIAPLKSEWSEIRESLREEIGEGSYQSWISGLDVEGFENGTVRMGSPNRFVCDKVSDRFGARIRTLWLRTDPNVTEVVFTVANAGTRKTQAVSARTAGGSPRITLAPASSEDDDGYGSTSVALDPSLRFDSFVVGKSNELAHAAARRVAESDGPGAAYNPLFLFGGVGLGKTHLMQGIAWETRTLYPHKKLLYVSAEKFMHRFVSSLRYKDTMSFKQEFRSVDILLIDDFQFIAGKESTQDEFFHTFNALIDRNRQIVISADRSPSDLEGVEDRIKSRLNWGLVADIGAPDYELRLGVLQSKLDAALSATPGLDVDPDVLGFIAKHVSSNMRVLEGALNRLVAHASLFGRRVDVDVAESILDDLLRAYDRKLTVEEIQSAVAEYFNVKLSDLLGPRRARAIARPRQIAMYLAKEMTDKSLPEIGRKFGGRDHTTIMHGVRRVGLLMKEDRSFGDEVHRLMKKLKH